MGWTINDAINLIVIIRNVMGAIAVSKKEEEQIGPDPRRAKNIGKTKPGGKITARYPGFRESLQRG